MDIDSLLTSFFFKHIIIALKTIDIIIIIISDGIANSLNTNLCTTKLGINIKPIPLQIANISV